MKQIIFARIGGKHILQVLEDEFVRKALDNSSVLPRLISNLWEFQPRPPSDRCFDAHTLLIRYTLIESG